MLARQRPEHLAKRNMIQDVKPSRLRSELAREVLKLRSPGARLRAADHRTPLAARSWLTTRSPDLRRSPYGTRTSQQTGLGEGLQSLDRPKPLTHSLCRSFSIALSHKGRWRSHAQSAARMRVVQIHMSNSPRFRAQSRSRMGVIHRPLCW